MLYVVYSVHVHVIVGRCLATKTFIGKLLATCGAYICTCSVDLEYSSLSDIYVCICTITGIATMPWSCTQPLTSRK